MAQTKRRRRSKHRGTPAGTIESRGRTGRKPRPEERGERASRSSRGSDRFDRPPTWRGAVNRAALATIIFFVVVLALFRQPVASALSVAVFMFAVYIPLGFYTDRFLYTRRQRRKEGGG